MRVLHVSSGNLYGGVEAMLATLARHRATSPEMEPHFALCFPGRLSAELVTSGAPVHLLGEVRLRNPVGVLRARGRLCAVLRRERIDVVVFHSAWALVLFGRVARAAGVPTVMWLHGRADDGHWLLRLARRTPPDMVVCNSRFTASTLPALYPRVPGEVVHCPVEPERAGAVLPDAVRAELDTPHDAVVIVQASRMEAWKGHALLLRGLGELHDLPGWVCWVAGGAQRPEEAAYVEELQRLATGLGIAERVRFLGQRSDVPRLFAAADLHCQPNTGPEPFGIAFVEALGAGLPCVTTALGGALEIVDERCGVLVPPEDPKALGAALGELIMDGARRRRLGAAGPVRARELCDPAVQLPRLYGLLARLSPGAAAELPSGPPASEIVSVEGRVG
jgi:glycosyltransferase involved in cell wall biosynthesis